MATSDPHHAAFDVVGLADGAERCSFEADVALDQSGQPWLPASLPILMAVGGEVAFSGALDEVALAGAERAQTMLREWNPALQRVRIRADRAEPGQRADGVGCFFSGGVDSFYSALTRRDEITHLIFVQGFDVALDDERLAARALAGVQAAARELGKQLVVVRTDLRALSDRWSRWGEEYHGAALAVIGLLLAEHVGRVLIPSTFQTGDAIPWGSHAELDPQWSTSRVVFQHHGDELHRADKIGAISADPVALRHLRVCWQQENGEYNCGRCSKCIRTMAVLQAYGALEACATLPSTIDSSPLRRVRRPKPYEVIDARAILALLKARGVRDRALTRDLRGLVLRDSSYWRAARAMRERLRRR